MGIPNRYECIVVMYVPLLPHVWEYQIDKCITFYNNIRAFLATHVCEYQIDMSVYITII